MDVSSKWRPDLASTRASQKGGAHARADVTALAGRISLLCGGTLMREDEADECGFSSHFDTASLPISAIAPGRLARENRRKRRPVGALQEVSTRRCLVE